MWNKPPYHIQAHLLAPVMWSKLPYDIQSSRVYCISLLDFKMFCPVCSTCCSLSVPCDLSVSVALSCFCPFCVSYLIIVYCRCTVSKYLHVLLCSPSSSKEIEPFRIKKIKYLLWLLSLLLSLLLLLVTQKRCGPLKICIIINIIIIIVIIIIIKSPSSSSSSSLAPKRKGAPELSLMDSLCSQLDGYYEDSITI